MSALSRAVCIHCKSVGLTRDISTTSGDISCTSCGMVQEENPIVSEVTFSESSSGAATVQGSFVSADQARASIGGRGNSLDSREQTLSNGKRRIKSVANALRIPDFVSDAAYQWFHLALANNFVQGRRSQNVVAACLYVACRKEKTHHMLIDFSAPLQISVYSVGATFLKMVKALHITNLPLADPSLFIQHFAEKLDFGKHSSKVIKDASKLAQRMADDWIHEGRRPAGIAGACLLLAARMNNFHRTHAEIVAVAHVGEDTLQKRLNEFKQTHASKMTVKDFRTDGQAAAAALPPSYMRNLKQTEKTKKRLSDDALSGEEALRKNPILKVILGDSSLSQEEIEAQIKRVMDKRQNLLDTANDSASLHADSRQEVEEEKLEVIDSNKPRNLHLLPTSEDILARISSEKENFEDVDDEELNIFLLTDEESALKERLWTGLNHEYLKKQEHDRLKILADEEAGNVKGTKKRKKNAKVEEGSAEDLANQMGIANAVNSIGEKGDNLTAADSAKSVIQARFSKKINYGVLDNLFPGAPAELPAAKKD